jgi:hypothetical protein
MEKKGGLKLGIKNVFNSQKLSGLVKHKAIDAKFATIIFKELQRSHFLIALAAC